MSLDERSLIIHDNWTSVNSAEHDEKYMTSYWLDCFPLRGLFHSRDCAYKYREYFI